jgi:L-alanine-DL-glutamate epimerase-like enolase superfamily enzyme
MAQARTSIDLDAALAGLEPRRPKLSVERVRSPLREPFRISDHVFHDLETVVVRLEADGHVGMGEAAGVFYLGDEPDGMVRDLCHARGWIAEGLDHGLLARRMPPGGARNALDCALWALQARCVGVPVWQLLGMTAPVGLVTTFTLGNAAPEQMAARAAGYGQARAIKIKLSGDASDAERIRAVRQARPDVWLGVDANRSLTPDALRRWTFLCRSRRTRASSRWRTSIGSARSTRSSISSSTNAAG